MSPTSLGRLAAGAVLLVLMVAVASPAAAQTHARMVQTDA